MPNSDHPPRPVVVEERSRAADARPDRDVAKFIGAFADAHRQQAIVDAIKVGVFCLERARAGQDLDFVRREIESCLSRVRDALSVLPEETQRQVTAKIGTGEGQVLAPVTALVNEVKSAASEKIEGIRSLLQEEVDPAKENSSLGKALRALRDLLEPKRTDSIQGSVDAAVKHITSESGLLAKAVREVVAEALKPLQEEVSELAKEVRGKEAVDELLGRTTHKGMRYEEEGAGCSTSLGPVARRRNTPCRRGQSTGRRLACPTGPWRKRKRLARNH
jgi:hypothetical protein